MAGCLARQGGGLEGRGRGPAWVKVVGAPGQRCCCCRCRCHECVPGNVGMLEGKRLVMGGAVNAGLRGRGHASRGGVPGAV